MSKLSKWLKSAERAVSNVIPHEHSADRRAAQQAVADQIELYKTQKEALEKETKRIEDERKQEKDRINKKQIKSARNAYRAPGFMEEAETNTKYTDKLG